MKETLLTYYLVKNDNIKFLTMEIYFYLMCHSILKDFYIYLII